LSTVPNIDFGKPLQQDRIKRINVAKHKENPMLKAGKFGISKPRRGTNNR